MFFLFLAYCYAKLHNSVEIGVYSKLTLGELSSVKIISDESTRSFRGATWQGRFYNSVEPDTTPLAYRIQNMQGDHRHEISNGPRLSRQVIYFIMRIIFSPMPSVSRCSWICRMSLTVYVQSSLIFLFLFLNIHKIFTIFYNMTA